MYGVITDFAVENRSYPLFAGSRHREERSDAAISRHRRREERSDAAIQ